MKILALAAALVVLTQLGTIGAVLYVANREVARRGDVLLARGGSVAEQLARVRASRLHSAGAVLAADPRVTGALAGGDLDTAVFLMDDQRLRSGLDFAVLLSGSGRVVRSSGAAAGTLVSLPGLVQGALDPMARSLVRSAGVVYEMVAVPMGTGGYYIAMGLAVDGALAARIGQLAGVDVTLLARDDGEPAVLGSSLPGIDAATVVRELAAAEARSREPLRIAFAGNEQVSRLIPFVDGRNDVEILLSEPLRSVMEPYAAIRNTVLVLSAAALALGLLGGVLLSRHITRPVSALVGAARRIRDGNYREPVEAPATGEVAELARTLQAMQQAIAEREERITYQARFDALTGLPARQAALDRIGTLAAADRPLAVLVVDLNDFSEIDSSLGHDIGDALLGQAAERLRSALDARHLVARLEGHQFLVVLDGCDVDGALECGEDLLRLLAAGLSVRDVNVGVNARIGLAAGPDHGSDPDQLLQRASMACRTAREAEASLRVYEPGNEEAHRRQLTILADLRRAVRHDELRLFLQPKVNLADGRVCGAEALVRWQHPTLGFLTPDQFIPIAEKSGNITLVTRWALAAAVRECRLLQEEGLDLPISVNLSGRDLQDRSLHYFIVQLLRDHDLDARYLTLEITEAALVRDFTRATVMLQCLRDLGIQVSIDDFGTGYSSLSQVKKLPVDELKIDRSFVAALPDDRADTAIVRATIDLAHDLGLAVLAEGVENEAALDWLRDAGCERAQGYLISRPMPAEGFARWARAYGRQEAMPGGVPGGLPGAGPGPGGATGRPAPSPTHTASSDATVPT